MGRSAVLLKNGTVIRHGIGDAIFSCTADVLVEDGFITKVGEVVAPLSGSVEVIDCTGKLIAPGFVDTHRHLWQTQLKGRHANHILAEYLVGGNMASQLYDPDDVYWGVIGGVLESIDAGTTTIVDYAHISHSEEHVRESLNALIASGARAFFCLSTTTRVMDWGPTIQISPELSPQWFLELLPKLAKEQPFGDGRVYLSWGFDDFSLPKEKLVELFKEARSLGVKLIHPNHLHAPPGMDAVKPMVAAGLLGPDVLFAHVSGATPEDVDSILSAGAHFSSTPSTEMQMGLGYPMCFHPELGAVASLGCDCHSAASASLVSEGRLVLQSARAVYNQPHIEKNVAPRQVNVRTEDVFNLATVKGARAVGLEGEIGSIAEGKRADLVVWDTTSPGMIAAAQHDPVSAIILHSSVKDVELVMVNGDIRKRDQKLLPIKLAGRGDEMAGWSTIATQLLESQKKLQEKASKIDFAHARKTVFG